MPGIHVTHLAISKLQGIDDQRNGSRRLLSVVGEPNASAWVCVGFFNLPSAGHVWTRWWRLFPTSSLRRSRLKLSFRTSTHRLTGIFQSGLCHYRQVFLPTTHTIHTSRVLLADSCWRLLCRPDFLRFPVFTPLSSSCCDLSSPVRKTFYTFFFFSLSLSLFSPSLSHLIVGFA